MDRICIGWNNHFTVKEKLRHPHLSEIHNNRNNNGNTYVICVIGIHHSADIRKSSDETMDTLGRLCSGLCAFRVYQNIETYDNIGATYFIRCNFDQSKNT